MKGLNWKTVTEVVKLAEKAGRFQLKYFRKKGISGRKEKASKELVSMVDVETENILLKGLKCIIPEAGFFGEESGRSGDQKLAWIVDPLDGTTNYLMGIPLFSISIALVKGSTPLMGVVYNPANGETFTALRGKGARWDGQKMQPIKKLKLRQAIAGTGFPFRSPDIHADYFRCASEILHSSLGMRRLGSAAIDLSYVAAGILGCFWEVELQPYDVAAAIAVMNECDCICRNFHGEDYDMFRHRTICAGGREVVKELCKITEKHFRIK